MKLTYQDVEDLLVTALEGGSNYWYYLPDLSMVPKTTGWNSKFIEPVGKTDPMSVRIAKAVWDGARVPVADVNEQGRKFENEPIGYITRDGIDESIERMVATNGKRAAANIIDDNYDANDADVWFQFVVLGKLVYG